MELTFEKIGDWYISEFEVTSDFNLHIEKEPKGDFYLYQRTSSSGQYDIIEDFGYKKGGDNVIDLDFQALVYPKWIKIKSAVKPLVAELTMDMSGGGNSGDNGDSDDGVLRRNDVNFFDYDGTLLHSYSWEKAKELTELPALPVHDGLEVREWNYTLEDIKMQGVHGFEDNDGRICFYAGDVTINDVSYKAYSYDGTLTCAWAYMLTKEPQIGDVIMYADYDSDLGEYVFTPDTYEIINVFSTIGKADVGACCYDDSGNQILSDGVLIYERGVTSIKAIFNAVIGVFSIPVTIDWIYRDTLVNVLFTSEVKIPASVNVANDGYDAFYESCAPNVYWNGGRKDYIKGILPIPIVDIPKNVCYINNLFQDCITKFSNIDEISLGDFGESGCKVLLDFTSVDYVPYLLDGIYVHDYAVCMIVVPDSLYEEWITATNWADVSDYIYPLYDVPWVNNK